MIERFLESHPGQVGSADDMTPYFRGTMRMHGGPLGESDHSEIHLFLGRTKDRTLALAGSRKHVWGQEGMVQMRAWSAAESIKAAVGEHISAAPELADAIRNIRRRHVAESEFEAAVLDPPDSALPSVHMIWLSDPEGEREPPPAQNFEFLARRLLDGEIESHARAPELTRLVGRTEGQRVRVTIGTPLYVALAD